MRKLSAVVVSCVLLTGGLGGVGCSSNDDAPAGDGCVGTGSEALKVCATGPTVDGVDVSSYQGNVSWPQIKASGRAFAFVRISDGLNSPDSKFAQNWPAMKSAGIMRGAYQFFRPSQDAGLQAQMVIDKLADNGGLLEGDLPPVLDLESASGQSSATVVSKAKKWLAAVEAATGIRPIVYTAAFMSEVIGDNFGGYTLWVANYGVTCPTMPSGWTSWDFWQSSDKGKVPGISGGVDLDFFNGTLSALQTHTLQPSASGGVAATPGFTAPSASPTYAVGDSKPDDGSEGATIGDGTPSQDLEGATMTPCR